MAMVRRAQRTTTSMSMLASLDDYGLGGVECEICGNKGYVVRKDEQGNVVSSECRCMAQRRSMRKLRESGMLDMIARYTFETYQANDEKRDKIKRTAEGFADGDDGWMYVFGRSGSGKTHICTAACVRLISRGIEVYYMSWRDESTALKSLVMDSDSYEKKMRKLKTVPVLYIDDFFKGGFTDADIRLAFEIINARYNDTSLRTIISSEVGLETLVKMDEALGGRIYERSRGHIINTPDSNWRMQ